VYQEINPLILKGIIGFYPNYTTNELNILCECSKFTCFCSEIPGLRQISPVEGRRRVAAPVEADFFSRQMRRQNPGLFLSLPPGFLADATPPVPSTSRFYAPSNAPSGVL
jgi:hypothetical protein